MNIAFVLSRFMSVLLSCARDWLTWLFIKTSRVFHVETAYFTGSAHVADRILEQKWWRKGFRLSALDSSLPNRLQRRLERHQGRQLEGVGLASLYIALDEDIWNRVCSFEIGTFFLRAGPGTCIKLMIIYCSLLISFGAPHAHTHSRHDLLILGSPTCFSQISLMLISVVWWIPWILQPDDLLFDRVSSDDSDTVGQEF